jgi:hypothetical protein
MQRASLILCIVVVLLMWTAGWMIGGPGSFALAVVFSAPIVGLSARYWLPGLLGGSVRAVRQLAYRDIEGRHYEFKGRAMMVREDLDGDRWVRTQDIQKVLAGFPRDAVLRQMFPEALGQAEARHGLFLRAQALDSYLERNQDDIAVRFRHWLQREVIFPAQRAREIHAVKT